jgi:hypothetical protein
MQGRAPNLLGPKRSTFGGLVKFLAVGYGLNEFSPKANNDLIILARSMAVYLKPHTSSLRPAPSHLLSRLRRLMSRTQEAETQEVAPKARDIPDPTSRAQMPRGVAPTPAA